MRVQKSCPLYSFWRTSKFVLTDLLPKVSHYWRDANNNLRCYWRCVIPRSGNKKCVFISNDQNFKNIFWGCKKVQNQLPRALYSLLGTKYYNNSIQWRWYTRSCRQDEWWLRSDKAVPFAAKAHPPKSTKPQAERKRQISILFLHSRVELPWVVTNILIFLSLNLNNFNIQFRSKTVEDSSEGIQ